MRDPLFDIIYYLYQFFTRNRFKLTLINRKVYLHNSINVSHSLLNLQRFRVNLQEGIDFRVGRNSSIIGNKDNQNPKNFIELAVYCSGSIGATIPSSLENLRISAYFRPLLKLERNENNGVTSKTSNLFYIEGSIAFGLARKLLENNTDFTSISNNISQKIKIVWDTKKPRELIFEMYFEHNVEIDESELFREIRKYLKPFLNEISGNNNVINIQNIFSNIDSIIDIEEILSAIDFPVNINFISKLALSLTYRVDIKSPPFGGFGGDEYMAIYLLDHIATEQNLYALSTRVATEIPAERDIFF